MKSDNRLNESTSKTLYFDRKARPTLRVLAKIRNNELTSDELQAVQIDKDVGELFLARELYSLHVVAKQVGHPALAFLLDECHLSLIKSKAIHLK